MTRDDLKTMGLADEIIEKVMALHGAKMTAATNEMKSTKEQIAQLMSDLEKAKNSTGDIDELRAKLAQSEKDMFELKKSQAVRDAIAAYNPKDAELLLKLIDIETVNVTDAGVVGLKEQVEPIKATKAYLFSDSPDPKGGGTVDPPGGSAPKSMNDILRGL